MGMKKCPVCGEEYSDTYKTCPFCEERELEETDGDSQRTLQQTLQHTIVRRKKRHVVHDSRHSEPNIISPMLVFIMVILMALLVFLFFSDSLFSGDKPIGGGGATSSASSTGAGSGSGTASGSGAGSGAVSAAGSGEVSGPPPAPSVDPLEEISAQPNTLSLNKTDFTMSVGDTPVTLKVSGGGDGYTWVSDNEEVATVDENGKVVAISAGTANVMASDGSGKGVCIVRVKGSGTPNTGGTTTTSSGGHHTISKEDVTIVIGESFDLTVSGDADVTWSSSNSSIASVSTSGKVTGAGTGTATITAAVDGQSLTCIVRVK